MSISIPEKYALLLEQVHMKMEENNPAYDREDMLYFANVLLTTEDRKGFIFDLVDVAKKLEQRKDNLKRILIPKEGQQPKVQTSDYKIVKINREFTETTNPAQSPSKLFPSRLRKTKITGRKPETILLTANGVCHLALCSGKPIGRVIRQFVIDLLEGLAKFKTAIDRGDIELRVGAQALALRDGRRLKSCEGQKTLMMQVKRFADQSPNPGGAVYQQLNGVMNKEITGKTKTQHARDRGLSSKEAKRFNLRDHMRSAQLSMMNCAQDLLEERLASKSTNEVVDVKRMGESLCRALTTDPQVRNQLHSGLANESRTVREARKAQRALANDPEPKRKRPRTEAGTRPITSFFRPKNQ